jgi:uncharacterized cofD-like protein
MMQAKKIVTIGGGTGTFTVLSGLKKYPPDMVDLTAIVTMADSGGSTGRLRDEFGYLPVGDVRMALAALSDISEGERNVLRELFLYRFDKGEGLNGHNFGNLFLVALTDILGSEEKAIEYAGKVLRVPGRVLPVTALRTDLVARYTDGTVVKGESHIDEPEFSFEQEKKIEAVYLEPQVAATEKALRAIEQADCVVLGPGDLYTSIVPNLLVSGMQDALVNTSAKLVYVVNLMTKFGQTSGYSMQDHVREIARYAGRVPDVVIMNSTVFPEEILSLYEKEHEFPVVDMNEDIGCEIVRADIVAKEAVKRKSGDMLKRSLIRHDPRKLAEAVMSLL